MRDGEPQGSANRDGQGPNVQIGELLEMESVGEWPGHD